MRISASLLIHPTDQIQLLLTALRLMESETNVSRRRPHITAEQTQSARNLRINLLQQIKENSLKKVKAYRETAETFAKDGEIEIDPGAPVSTGADDGAYVQAWIWVSDDDVRNNRKKTTH
jgi:hypothetical protein